MAIRVKHHNLITWWPQGGANNAKGKTYLFGGH